MDQGAAQVLRPHLREVQLGDGEVLSDGTRFTDQVVFPNTAVISCVRLLSDGRAIGVNCLGFRDAVGVLDCLSGSRSDARIVAQLGGSAVAVAGSRLRDEAARNPVFLSLLLKTAAAMTQRIEQNVICNALHDAPNRLARWLLQAQDMTGRSGFPLTQEELAVLTGVQRTTVSACASHLKAAGLIRYSRGRVQVLDSAGLRAAACECSDAPAGP